MDPNFLDELDEVDCSGEALRARTLDTQEQEWEDFVRRRDDVAGRKRREEQKAKTRNQQDQEIVEVQEEKQVWLGAPQGPLQHEFGSSLRAAHKASKENALEVLSRRQQERRARSPPPVTVPAQAPEQQQHQQRFQQHECNLNHHQQQQQPTRNHLDHDPFAAFCRSARTANLVDRENDRRMAELREQRDTAGVQGDVESSSKQEDVWRRSDREHSTQDQLLQSDDGDVRADRDELKGRQRDMQRLLLEIDRAEEEDREFEALKHLLPDLEHGGRVYCDVLARPPDERHQLLKLAVRYMQEQRSDINFEELFLSQADHVLHAGSHKEAEEGRLAAMEHAQQHLLLEEKAWMTERCELRRSQWTAAREAAEAPSRHGLAVAPRNTKIVCASASGSDVWPAAMGVPQPFASTGGSAYNRGVHPPAAKQGELGQPLMQVLPSRRGPAHGRVAAVQSAPSVEPRFRPPRSQAQQELTPARRLQLEQDRQRDQQARLDDFRQAWRRRKHNTQEPSPETCELD